MKEKFCFLLYCEVLFFPRFFLKILLAFIAIALKLFNILTGSSLLLNTSFFLFFLVAEIFSFIKTSNEKLYFIICFYSQFVRLKIKSHTTRQLL